MIDERIPRAGVLCIMNGEKLGALYHTIDHIAASIMNGMTSQSSSKELFGHCMTEFFFGTLSRPA